MTSEINQSSYSHPECGLHSSVQWFAKPGGPLVFNSHPIWIRQNACLASETLTQFIDNSQHVIKQLRAVKRREWHESRDNKIYQSHASDGTNWVVTCMQLAVQRSSMLPGVGSNTRATQWKSPHKTGAKNIGLRKFREGSGNGVGETTEKERPIFCVTSRWSPPSAQQLTATCFFPAVFLYVFRSTCQNCLDKHVNPL